MCVCVVCVLSHMCMCVLLFRLHMQTFLFRFVNGLVSPDQHNPSGGTGEIQSPLINKCFSSRRGDGKVKFLVGYIIMFRQLHCRKI